MLLLLNMQLLLSLPNLGQLHGVYTTESWCIHSAYMDTKLSLDISKWVGLASYYSRVQSHGPSCFVCILCSYFLYSISHPNKYGKLLLDLSMDPESSIPASTLPPTQIAVERVITKTFTRYRCDVIITNRLCSVFTAKLWWMNKALQSLGGTWRSQLIEGWKSTKWMLYLAADEIISKKLKLQNTVINEREKVRKLEHDLKELTSVYKMSQVEWICFKSQLKRLINPSSLGANPQPSHGRKRKSWSECSEMASNTSRLYCFDLSWGWHSHPQGLNWSTIRQMIVTVDDIIDFNVELFLGTDLKFLAAIVGIQSANETYTWVWCKCPAAERYNTSIQWSFTDTAKGARTIDGIKTLCSRPYRRGVETWLHSRTNLQFNSNWSHCTGYSSSLPNQWCSHKPFNTRTKKTGRYRKASEGSKQRQSNQCDPIWALSQLSV